MSSIVKGDPLKKRNETEKSSKSDKKSENSEVPKNRNQKKTKNKQKNKSSEPKIIEIDSESPSSSKQPSKTETLSTSKKSSQTVAKESSGYGIIFGESPYLHFYSLFHMYHLRKYLGQSKRKVREKK